MTKPVLDTVIIRITIGTLLVDSFVIRDVPTKTSAYVVREQAWKIYQGRTHDQSLDALRMTQQWISSTDSYSFAK